MGLAHVAPLIAADSYRIVTEQTFGHLAPSKNKTYRGRILFTKSEYNSGTITLISTSFEDMPDSPWIYDAILEYLYQFKNLEYGAVYTVNTTIRNYRFWGKPVKVFSL